jgi:hypothetical protein
MLLTAVIAETKVMQQSKSISQRPNSPETVRYSVRIWYLEFLTKSRGFALDHPRPCTLHTGSRRTQKFPIRTDSFHRATNTFATASSATVEPDEYLPPAMQVAKSHFP